MEKHQKTRIVTALCAVSMMGMGSLALSSGLAYIAREFSHVGTVWIQLLVTGPVILQIPMGLMAGWLSTKFSRKKLILFSIALFLLCGILPFFVHVFPLILLMRIFYGGAIGLCTTLSGSLTFLLFLEEGERSRVIGLTGAFAMLGGTYYTLIGGFLSELGWQYCFLAYFIGVPILILAIAFLPNNEALSQLSAAAAGPTRAVYRPKPEVYWIAFLFLIYFTLYFAYTNNISAFILNNGLGSSSQSGWSYTIVNLSGFFGGLSFYFVRKYLHYWTLPFSVAVTGLGFFLIATADALPVVFLGSFLHGIAIGWYTPNNSILYGEIMPPEAMTFTIGITGAIGNIGQLLSTVAFAGVASALNITTERGVLLMSSYGYIVLVIVCAIYIALRIARAKKRSFAK
ncbi:MAG: MFS transporter [Lawsonibacter sp.]